MKRGFAVFLMAVWSSGCATQAQWVAFPSGRGGKGVTLEAWLKDHPIPVGQEMGIQELSRGEGDSASTHIVQVRRLEPMHIHKEHDVMAIVLRGKGTLTLGDRRLEVSPGSLISIPRGVPHSFRNKSSQPAVVYAMFTPAYDGKDRVLVEEESLVKRPASQAQLQ